MAIADDSPPPRDLPNLPDLPGMGGIPAGDAPTNATRMTTAPNFQVGESDELNDSGRQPLLELPDVKIAAGDATASIAGKDPYLGRQFGGYELVQKVGQGGMGLVYKGRQVSLDRVVAVKILNKALCDNEEFIKRFEREAKSIARINHPNIMAVYDFGQTDGMWYMVVEYIEGSSLSKRIADQLMIPPDEIEPILVQCLAGLAHVGLQGIVHRDIKPDNILITKDGVAKIADFGLAKDVTRNDTTDLTTVGMAMGTPAYMSPEQCMGRKLDGRSDIYSLGVTAYLALTGEKPFTGQSSFEIMTKQREYQPPPPSKLNPAVPREVSDLVMQMLAKNANDRFRDAESCRQAWFDLAQRLGYNGGAPAGKDSGSRNTDLPMSSRKSSPLIPALPPMPMATPPPPTLSIPPALPVAGMVPPPPPMTATRESARTAVNEQISKPKNRPITESQGLDGDGPGKHGSERVQNERQQRPTTERRASARAAGESSTCARCGLLNRAGQSACSRCGHELRETARDPQATKDQEGEAQRLFAAGNYRVSAEMYKRLADRESDKRARAILRSKEREARTLEQSEQVAELQNRSKGLLERGEIKAGIDLLERGLRDVRDTAASSTGAESRLVLEISGLRAKLRHRQRMRMIIIMVLVAALLIGGVLAKLYLMAPAAAKTASLVHATRATES
jgi:serine/threonine protein kinase